MKQSEFDNQDSSSSVISATEIQKCNHNMIAFPYEFNFSYEECDKCGHRTYTKGKNLEYEKLLDKHLELQDKHIKLQNNYIDLLDTDLSVSELLQRNRDMIARIRTMKRAMKRGGLNQWVTDWLSDDVFSEEIINKTEERK